MIIRRDKISRSCKMPAISLPKSSSSNTSFKISVSTPISSSMKHPKKGPGHFPRSSSVFKNKNLISSKCFIMKSKKDQITKNLHKISERIQHIHHLQDRFQTNFASKDLKNISNSQLEKIAKKRFEGKIKIQAYSRISNWWKRVFIVKMIYEDSKMAENAAKIIQKKWKIYLDRKREKAKLQELKERRERAAVVIQKNVRGFFIRNLYWRRIKFGKMDRLFQQFEKMRTELFEDFGERICKVLLRGKARVFLKNFREKVKSEKNVKKFHLSVIETSQFKSRSCRNSIDPIASPLIDLRSSLII